MIEKIFNYLGEDITNIPIELLSSQYGYVDSHNIPHIDWGNETDICDKNGFDKQYKVKDNSNVYLIDNYVLPKGITICRYGFSGGYFTTLRGEDYENLGLPYIKETIEYHEYKVSTDLQVNCIVRKGMVAPKFNSPGGGVQFMHKQTIRLEIEDGFIKEDMSWIQKNI